MGAKFVTFSGERCEKLLFRIKEAGTALGHEFQAKFCWQVEDQGIQQCLQQTRNAKIEQLRERPHRSDQQELQQLLLHNGDVDPAAKLREREFF